MSLTDDIAAFAKLLPRHEVSLTITHNDHKDVYQSVGDRFDGETWFDWVSEEERQKAIQEDSVWTIQWYPHTPVGFCALGASSLEAVMLAVQDESEDPTPTERAEA